MPVGEKWAYAICLLHILMCIHNVWPFLSLYDINCRWGPHFRRFVEQQSGWHPALCAWALAMPLPLPPFHIKMHSASCAERNSLKCVDGAGRGCGEPHEICNRFLGQSGMTLQYAAKPVRELWLELQMLAWQRKKEIDLAPLLVRMWMRATAQWQLSLTEQAQLAEQALKLGATEEQVRVC
jgi:hypothetical protein